MRPDPIRLLLQARRKAIAAGIVLAGLAAGLVIYVTAGPAAENPLGYRPEDTKRYLRQMEVYGGKANVMAAGFREWFGGLWHGRTLAFTVAVLSALLALAFLFAFTPLPPADQRAGTAGHDRNGSGP
jgi:hypothetical protein